MNDNETTLGIGAKIGLGIGAAIGVVLLAVTGSIFWGAILIIAFMFIGGIGGFFIDEAIANAEERSFNIKAVAWVVAIILIIVFCVFGLKGCGSRSDKGYWGSDGYYNPSQSEMEDARREAEKWMQDNWN